MKNIDWNLLEKGNCCFIEDSNSLWLIRKICMNDTIMITRKDINSNTSITIPRSIITRIIEN